MSLLKKVLNAVKKMFKVSVKRPRGSRRFSKRVKRSVKVRKASSVRKISKPSVKKSKPAKGPKPDKPILKKQITAPVRPKAKVQDKVRSLKTAQVGEVTHYFDKIKVCVIRIDRGILKKGDRLVIAGNKGSLTQLINSMQIENADVSVARKGQLIGLKVAKEVYVGDSVAIL